MNYGLYLSAGGALTSMHRQDVAANNLANLNTVGFKPDFVAIQNRLPARLDGNNFGTAGALTDAQLLLEQLGGGGLVSPTRINSAQGDLSQSANDLDVALTGQGFFVVSKSDSPGSDAQRLRFTRDGRFTLGLNNELIMTTTGMQVLDVQDQPIYLNPGAKVKIDRNGQIRQNGEVVAQLQVASVSNPTALVKEGANLLRMPPTQQGPSNTRVPAPALVRQNMLEASAVDPVLALNAMINASKSVAANANMMQYHDHLLDQMVNTFGRVA